MLFTAIGLSPLCAFIASLCVCVGLGGGSYGRNCPVLMGFLSNLLLGWIDVDSAILCAIRCGGLHVRMSQID